MVKINITVSVGELLDKISILKIKLKKIKDKKKLVSIMKEFELLNSEFNKLKVSEKKMLDRLFQTLTVTNERLWNIEDKIRLKEKNKSFDSEFIELARSVYFTNDKRSDIKKKINAVTNSQIVEVKEYEKY